MSAEGRKYPGWVLVPVKGIEPLTRSLQGCRSATELDRQIWFRIPCAQPSILANAPP